MASLNKVILIGNLGKDPETRYAPSADAITNLTLATTETWQDKGTGERREATEWHGVVFFGKVAEIAAQYLRKGSKVYIEGQLETRKWQDQSGQDRYTTEVVLRGFGGTLTMLDRRDGDNAGGSYSEGYPGGSGSAGSYAANSPSGGYGSGYGGNYGGGLPEDEIPF